MFYRERFYDLESTYVIVDAHDFRRARQPMDSSLERVPKREVRWVIEKMVRDEPLLFARLYEALMGVRLPVQGGSSLRTTANTDAVVATMIDAFGASQFSNNQHAEPDFARFYLLRSRRIDKPLAGRTESREGQRIDQALSKLGSGPLTHRGATYQLHRAGHAGNAVINRNSYETLSEAQLFTVLRELAAEPNLDADKKAAVQELTTAAEEQCAKTGSTELVLLRLQRVFARAESSGPAITPSQMKRAREQERISEWQISLVSSDGLPIPEAGYIITFADGTSQSGRLDRNGKAKITGPKGPYSIQYVNHADLRAKALAARVNKAINGSDAAALLGVLSQPANELGLVRDHYATYFGRDLASAARGALGGDENTALGDHLLAAANLAPDATKAVYAYADPSRRPDELANADKGTAIA